MTTARTKAHESLATTLDEQLPLLALAASNRCHNTLEAQQQQQHRRVVVATVLEAIADFMLSVDGKSDDTDDQLRDDSGNVASLSMQQLVRQGMSALVHAVGAGDAQLLESQLELVARLESETCIQVILDYLPALVEIDDTDMDDECAEKDDRSAVVSQQQQEQVFSSLRGILERENQSSSLTLPILGCLSAIPLTDAGKSEAFQIALRVVSIVPEEDLPSLVRALLRQVSNAKEATMAWEALRVEMQLLEETEKQESTSTTCHSEADDDPTALVAQVVLTCFADSRTGSLLAETYVKTVEGLEARNPHKMHCNSLDLIVLIVLSENESLYEDATDRLFDVWLTKHRFPFRLLDSLLDRFCGSGGDRLRHHNESVLYQRLAPCLLRLALFLLLAPIRAASVGPETLKSIQLFVLHLHDKLERDLQAELVRSLLHLSEGAPHVAAGCELRAWSSISGCGKKRKRSERGLSQPPVDVVQSVNAVLLQLAERSPRSLIRFKHILIERLTSTNFFSRDANGTNKYMEEICSILGALVSSDHLQKDGGLDSSELMMLLQKLLFSSSGGFGRAAGDLTQVISGLILGRALISSAALSHTDKESVKEWVLRILLPSTRRMLQPELGGPCLAFLKAAMSRDETSGDTKSVFHHFQMILANTGLIQMLSLYQKTTHGSKTDIVLGYEQIPAEYFVASGKARNMVFCVNYFLDRNELSDTVRWACATRWVIELVDTYLEIGRRSSKWLPDGWLQASIEIVYLKLPATLHTKKKSEAVMWVQTEINNFDLEEVRLDEPPRLVDDLALAVHESTATSESIELLLRLVLRFEGAVLIGLALSLAVLKNAYEKHRTQEDDGALYGRSQSDQNLRLIQYQLIKMYDLRSKSCLILKLLRAVGVSIRRHVKRQKGTRTRGGARVISNSTPSAPDNASSVAVSGASSTISMKIPSSDMFCLDVQLETQHEKVVRATDHIDLLTTTLFYGSDHMCPAVLWECLECRSDEKIIRDNLERLLCSPVATPNEPLVVRMMQLKRNIADHLCRLVAAARYNVPVPRSAILHVARSIKFFLDALPRVRLLVSDACGNQETNVSLMSA
jgi:hypothetical protein